MSDAFSYISLILLIVIVVGVVIGFSYDVWKEFKKTSIYFDMKCYFLKIDYLSPDYSIMPYGYHYYFEKKMIVMRYEEAVFEFEENDMLPKIGKGIFPSSLQTDIRNGNYSRLRAAKIEYDRWLLSKTFEDALRSDE